LDSAAPSRNSCASAPSFVHTSKPLSLDVRFQEIPYACRPRYWIFTLSRIHSLLCPFYRSPKPFVHSHHDPPTILGIDFLLKTDAKQIRASDLYDSGLSDRGFVPFLSCRPAPTLESAAALTSLYPFYLFPPSSVGLLPFLFGLRRLSPVPPLLFPLSPSRLPLDLSETRSLSLEVLLFWIDSPTRVGALARGPVPHVLDAVDVRGLFVLFVFWFTRVFAPDGFFGSDSSLSFRFLKCSGMRLLCAGNFSLFPQKPRGALRFFHLRSTLLFLRIIGVHPSVRRRWPTCFPSFGIVLALRAPLRYFLERRLDVDVDLPPGLLVFSFQTTLSTLYVREAPSSLLLTSIRFSWPSTFFPFL